MISNPFENIVFILVETLEGGNLGSAARAMKTMGFHNLRLVNPAQHNINDIKKMSMHAYDVCQNARTFTSLSEAIADCSLVVATSARIRRIPWPSLELVAAAPQMAKQAAKSKVAIIFGREDSGLSSEDLQAAHLQVFIDANPEYPILNLASSIQLVSYQLRCHLNPSQPQKNIDELITTWQKDWDEPIATKKEVANMLAHLEKLLIQVEYLDPGNPRHLMARIQRLYQRFFLDKTEVNILRGFYSHIEKRLENTSIHSKKT